MWRLVNALHIQQIVAVVLVAALLHAELSCDWILHFDWSRSAVEQTAIILIAERLVNWQLFHMLSYHVTEYCTVIGPFSIHCREIGWVPVCSQLSKVSIWTSKYPKAIYKLIRAVHSYSMNFSGINIHQFHQSYLDVHLHALVVFQLQGCISPALSLATSKQ